MIVDEEMCEKFGLDPLKVKQIAARISRAAKEASDMGLTVFGGGSGGGGSGSLRFQRAEKQGPGHSEVASLDGDFDGGDGGDVY
jgi:hypothetical protein